MILERVLWIALIVTVSMFLGWILGNLYAISHMGLKRRRRLNKETDEGDRLPEVLGREERTPLLKKPPSPEVEIVTQGDPRKA